MQSTKATAILKTQLSMALATTPQTFYAFLVLLRRHLVKRQSLRSKKFTSRHRVTRSVFLASMVLGSWKRMILAHSEVLSKRMLTADYQRRHKLGTEWAKKHSSIYRDQGATAPLFLFLHPLNVLQVRLPILLLKPNRP